MDKSTNKTALEISRSIACDNIPQAIQQLMEIANKDGDKQIIAILKELPSVDMLAIFRNSDMGRSDGLHTLVSPSQFGEMIRFEEQYAPEKSIATSRINGMISAIIFGENNNTTFTSSDFLREMLASESGMREFLKFITPPGGTPDEQENHHHQLLHFLKFGTFDLDSHESDSSHDHDDMSWRHALQIVRNELPDEAELLVIALNDYKNKLYLNPADSIPHQKTVLMSSGKEELSAL